MLEEERFHVELGLRARQRRELLGFTQDQVAEALGLSRTSVVNIEKGRQRLLAYQLVRLAGALRTTPTELLPPSTDERDADMRRLLLRERPSVVDWVSKEIANALEEPK